MPTSFAGPLRFLKVLDCTGVSFAQCVIRRAYLIFLRSMGPCTTCMVQRASIAGAYCTSNMAFTVYDRIADKAPIVGHSLNHAKFAASQTEYQPFLPPSAL